MRAGPFMRYLGIALDTDNLHDFFELHACICLHQSIHSLRQGKRDRNTPPATLTTKDPPDLNTGGRTRQPKALSKPSRVRTTVGDLTTPGGIHHVESLNAIPQPRGPHMPIVITLLFIAACSFITTGLWYCFDDWLAQVLANPAVGSAPFMSIYALFSVIGALIGSLRAESSG